MLLSLSRGSSSCCARARWSSVQATKGKVGKYHLEVSHAESLQLRAKLLWDRRGVCKTGEAKRGEDNIVSFSASLLTDRRDSGEEWNDRKGRKLREKKKSGKASRRLHEAFSLPRQRECLPRSKRTLCPPRDVSVRTVQREAGQKLISLCFAGKLTPDQTRSLKAMWSEFFAQADAAPTGSSASGSVAPQRTDKQKAGGDIPKVNTPSRPVRAA